VYGFDMTPFKEVVLGRQRTVCEPEITILSPEQLLSEPQVRVRYYACSPNDVSPKAGPNFVRTLM
jgi:hypothetical protein